MRTHPIKTKKSRKGSMADYMKDLVFQLKQQKDEVKRKVAAGEELYGEDKEKSKRPAAADRPPPK